MENVQNILKLGSRFVKRVNFTVMWLVCFLTSSSVLAIDIAQDPLFLKRTAIPNVMFILDDSGSMDWEILTVPHFEAYNYDRDANRSWARGGGLNGDYRNRGMLRDGDWISYAGYCHDRNADGICYNRLDLNGDGDKDDPEITGTSGSPATYSWHLRLKHLYHWNYPQGYCKAPSSGNSDARDYLPNVGDVLAWFSASGNVQAHTYIGTSWDAPANKPYAGMTDSVYDDEKWEHSGSDTDNPDDPAAYNAAKTACLAKGDGSTWERLGSAKVLVHTGTTPWTSAGTIANPTAVNPGYTPGVVGDYHQEELYNTGSPAVAAAGNLDINGDGATDTPVYRETDDWGIKRARYHYLHELEDNVYRNPNGPWGYNNRLWQACSESQNYSSVDRCNYLRYWDFPNGYPYNATAPAPATSPYLGGNQKILTLPTFVPRIIQPSWPNPPAAQVRFDVISWAPWSDPARGIINRTTPVGTRHALNKWDPWPMITDWRIRSSSFNVLYYDPKNDYKPWPGLETPVSSFTAARSNPQPGSAGYTITKNLARPHTDYDGTNEEGGFVYEIWHDDAGYWSNRPQWHSTEHCDTGGWRISVKSNNGANTRYPGVRGVVAGVTDPATGKTVTLSDRVCFTYNDVPNGIVDLWDKRDRVTVYTNKIVVQTVRRTPHIFGESLDNDSSKKVAMSDTRILDTVVYEPANYASYSTDAFCISVLGEDPTNPGHCRTLAQVQTNIATWYEFSRKRSFVAKGAIANLITTLPDLNYGLMGTSRSDTVAHNRVNPTDLSKDISKLFRDVYDGTGSGNGDAVRTTHNTNLITALYDHVFRQSGTPLRQALQRAGEYFAGRGPLAANSGDTVNHNTSPITQECQKNFALMLTDGYRSGLVPADVSGTDRFGNTVTLNNADGDPYSKTLADVAKYYYDEDLRPALADQVRTDNFDQNNAQHLSLIGIGFGVSGNLTDPDGDGWPGTPDASGALTYTESTDWGNPNNNPRKLDDLWHAAYNSRGLYLNAKNPAELITKLNDAILYATATVGSGSSVSANSQMLTASTRLYQTLFKSGEWTGDVKSYSLNTLTGQLITPADWSAQTLLDARTASDRKIFTLGLTDGVPFRWTSLVDASSATASVPDQQMALRTRWATGTVESVAFGQAQLNYIRGANDPQFRSRTHKLGDIVHSEPLYVGAPGRMMSSFISEASSYPTFVSTHSGRKPMLYVGANDGMLHAFDAQTGEEVFAYIPRVLIPKLNSLTHKDTISQRFRHYYFVDDAPVTNDVYFSGAWHTVLVGGLRGGGKGIYALDVTTVPSSTDAESTIATEKGLWEFTDKDDGDMGYSFSKPSIVRLNNGKWAAVFGNGYGSANGKAVLYIVEFNDGHSYGTVHKFDTKVGSTSNENGLSTPTVIDTNGDGIADRVYAGDLLGNVWAWDISDSNDANWKTRFGTTATPAPLFTATDGAGGVQPITAAITVERHPKGSLAGYLLHFGTGKFFSTTDNNDTGQVTQSVYAIWDYGVAGVTRSNLLQQQILAEPGYQSVSTVRVTSNNGPIQWMNTGYQVGDSGWQGHVKDKGWYMDLVNTEGGNTDNHGERVVSKMRLSGPSVLFSTLLPSGNACEGGGSGWRMALQKYDGARFDTPFLDINGDGLFTPDDTVSFNNGSTTEDVAVSGVKSEVGIPSMPLMLRKANGHLVSISDSSSGEISKDDPSKDPKKKGPEGVLGVNGALNGGRRSWIELR